MCGNLYWILEREQCSGGRGVGADYRELEPFGLKFGCVCVWEFVLDYRAGMNASWSLGVGVYMRRNS